MYNLLLLAQKPVGEQCFEWLVKQPRNNIELKAVSSNSSTDNWWASNNIYRYCQEAMVDFVNNDAKNHQQLEALIEKHHINLIISIQHNWVLPEALLNKVEGRAFNLHLAKLPNYKGYNSFSHAILNGDTSYGVTLHWMTKQVDCGAIAYQAEFPISNTDTAKSLCQQASDTGYGLFQQLIADLQNNKTIPKHEMSGDGCFYPRNSLAAIKSVNHEADFDRIARACYFPPFEPAHIMSAQQQKTYLLPASAYSE